MSVLLAFPVGVVPSSQLIVVDDPAIVTAVGITTAIGVDIVGVSVAIEGVKLISQKVKWPIGDKWKASLN